MSCNLSRKQIGGHDRVTFAETRVSVLVVSRRMNTLIHTRFVLSCTYLAFSWAYSHCHVHFLLFVYLCVGACVVTHVPLLHCDAFTHRHCVCQTSRITLNICWYHIVLVAISLFCRHDIVCTVHLRLVRPDESRRYRIFSV